MNRKNFPLNFPPGLAKKMNIDPVHLSRIKHGKVKASYRLALKIYKAALNRVRLTDLVQADEDFIETCRIVVEESEKNESH